MAGSLDVVVPIRVKRIEKAQLTPGDVSGTDNESHDAGFAAGHEEGRLRAEWEANRERQKDRARVDELVHKLEKLHQEFEALIAEHVPDLILGALNRVFKQHPFSIQEITNEVTALLRDMEQAGRIALECSPTEAEELRAELEQVQNLADGERITLEANPTLQPGEFILKSDLGDVDGRHSSRIRQIHLALEGR